MRRWSLLLTVAGCLPTLLAAQVRGVPVMVSGVTVGTTLGVDVGVANHDAGGSTTLGASISSGFGPIALSGMVSRGAPFDGADAVWGQAVGVGVRLYGGPFVPFRVMMQSGVGFWSRGVVDHLHVPVALGVSATIPNPAFAIRPWLAPRVSYQRQSFQGEGTSDTHVAMSGGIDLAFIGGLVVRAAYDREFVDGASPGVFSAGFSYGLGRH
ncbi:MAG TPA: hypothetical protein VFN22_04880 [Gemmatimonadales bacterium]|nr:hypothetical protein [Gemmatimonadales bacterium]